MSVTRLNRKIFTTSGTGGAGGAGGAGSDGCIIVESVE